MTMRRGWSTPTRLTIPAASNATKRTADLNPNPWTLRARSKTPNGPGHGDRPRNRSACDLSSINGGERQPSQVNRTVVGWLDPDALLRSRAMAKAKRRRIRARRKKANHGRRPNAGRGK
jgi:hypothetical protein